MNAEKLLVPLVIRGDKDGRLTPLESGREAPFDIKRVYFIYGTQPGVRRGRHAHRQLRQLAVCVRGSCRFLMDDGQSRCELRLDRPDRGLLIEPMIWHEMDDFSPDCVIAVVASAFYDEADYIRNYEDFTAAAKAAGR